MRAREIDDENRPEPVPGLPEKLPDGETIVWQGSPGFLALAIHAFRVRAVAVYFGAIALWRAAAMTSSGNSGAEIGATMSAILLFFIAAMALLFLLAFMMRKETIYTITTQRVVMRFGVALRKSINIPFRLIASAGLKMHGNGYGDVALALTGPDRIAYLHLWPNVRPFKYAKAEPALRAIPDAARVARLLADAVKAYAGPDVAISAAPIGGAGNTTSEVPGIGAAAAA